MTEQLAIDGGTPVRTEPFPSWPIWDHREEEELLKVLHSGHWGEVSGQVTARFIRQFAEFQNAEYGVPVTNGTIALEVALSALGVGVGDEVITTAYTFIATASSAFAVGAKPVFVDIDPETNNIDPSKIEAAITPRTKVIVPVHIGGHPADMDGVMAVAKKHNLKVLEDAAQAWGAQWKGKGVGAIGDLGTFSFQSSKNITAGEGGAVLTDNRELYEMVWSLHNVGRLPEGGWYHHVNLGRNLRLSEFQGAILTAQLERLPDQTETRNRNAWRLIELLEKIPGIKPIKPHPNATRSSWHIFQMRYDAAAFGGHDRDQFLDALRAEGVPCSAGYVPLIHAPAIRNTLAERFGPESLNNLQEVPHADAAGRTTAWLTQSMLLGTDEDIAQIAEAVAKIQRAWGA